MLSSDKMTFWHQNVAATQVARLEVIMFGYRMWYRRAKYRSTLMAVIVSRETQQSWILRKILACDRREREPSRESGIRAMAMLTGRTRNPTKRSETARLHSKMVDGVRREGFLHTAASTKTLPAMHIGISRALRTLFMITEVSKGEDSSLLSSPPGIISSVEFAISNFSILSPISLQRESAYYFLYSFTWLLIKITTTLPVFNSLTYI